jgi:predicted nucleic acid-binding Zn ribbon protein
MYCPECGLETSEGLRYCNRCGANLIGETGSPRLFGIVLALVIAVLVVGAVGLFAIFFFAVEFLGRGDVKATVVLFVTVFTLVFFGIEILLIRQMSRLLGVYLKDGGSTRKETRGGKESKSQSQLNEARQIFVKPDSPHKTGTGETEPATRILPSEETATRKLENDEKTKEL